MKKKQRNVALGFNKNNKNNTKTTTKQPITICGSLNKDNSLCDVINRDIPKNKYIKEIASSNSELVFLTLDGQIYSIELDQTDRVFIASIFYFILNFGVNTLEILFLFLYNFIQFYKL